MAKPKYSIGDIVVVGDNYYLIEGCDAGCYQYRVLGSHYTGEVGYWAFDDDRYIYMAA